MSAVPQAAVDARPLITYDRHPDHYQHWRLSLDREVATLSMDVEIRFRSAVERAAFSGELASAVTQLVSRYHDPSAPGGRAHRLVVVAHPLPHESQTKEPS